MAELRLKSLAVPRRAGSRLAAAGGAAGQGRGPLGRGAQRRGAAGHAGALPRGAVVAVGGAGDLARPRLIDYLESLSTRAYFFVYGARAGSRERLAQLLRARLAGGGEGAVARDPGLRRRSPSLARRRRLPAGDAGSRLVRRLRAGQGWSEGRDPTATTAFLRDTLYDNAAASSLLSVLATFLFTHNAEVAIWPSRSASPSASRPPF